MLGKNRKSASKHSEAEDERNGIEWADTKIPSDYDVYLLSKKEFEKYLLTSLLLLPSVGYLFYHSLIVSSLFALLSLPYMKLYKSELAEKRRNELRIQFKDALYSMSGSVSAGRRMPEAIAEAYTSIELIYGKESIMARELNHMTRQLSGTQKPDDEVLRDFAQRSHVEEIMNFADVYSACRKTGGDTVKIIMKAADIIMERMAVNRDIEVLISQKKMESKILIVVPVLIIAILGIISPGYMTVMYTTMTGRIIMTVSLSILAGAYIWGNKVSQIVI